MLSMVRRLVELAVILVLITTLAGCVRPASAPPGAPANPVSSPPPVADQRTRAVTEQSNETGLTTPVTPAPAMPSAVEVTPALPSAIQSPGSPTPNFPPEHAVTLIPLAGPLGASEAEVSGLAWYGDSLVFLPQYPERFGAAEYSGAVFVLDKAEILAYLDGKSQGPLQPRPVPFESGEVSQNIPGYEGFEAIAFTGDQFFVTIEASPDGMQGYLARGFVSPELAGLRLIPNRLAAIQPQAAIPNLSDELIVLFGDMLLTLYEANGTAVNPQPVAHLFDSELALRNQLAFPNIEYRLTDATPADEMGRFWAINTFYIGDASLYPLADPIADQYGKGLTHTASPVVERLLQFQFTEQGVVLADTPPIQLALAADGQSRNWEGIARLDDGGFLLVSDEHPQTLFAFVPIAP